MPMPSTAKGSPRKTPSEVATQLNKISALLSTSNVSQAKLNEIDTILDHILDDYKLVVEQNAEFLEVTQANTERV